MINEYILRSINASVDELEKILCTIQNNWKGKIQSITTLKNNNKVSYQIIFRIHRPVNISCRIPKPDKYGWRIPQKFIKTWKTKKNADEYIKAVKQCIIDRCGIQYYEKITEDQIMHIVYKIMCKDKYTNRYYESAECKAHEALIYAKDMNGKQIILY